MNKTYHIFGLTLASALPLPSPSVTSVPGNMMPDVTIVYGQTPKSLENLHFKGVRFQAGPNEFLLRVDGVARYYVKNGSHITIMPEQSAHEDDILLFLMGSVMGALLHQRNILVLHAGAIAVNGKSVIFSGISGVGKSTLTAGFHRRGYTFLADDLCAVNTASGHPSVISGFSRLKLWADTLKKLDTDTNNLKAVRWGGRLEKYFIPVETVQGEPVPIKAVFVLQTTNTDRLDIIEQRGSEKVNLLMDNTYRMNFLKGLGGKKNHFQQCTALGTKVQIFKTVRPTGGFLLDELMDAVESRLYS